jgi:hypothetical protein
MTRAHIDAVGGVRVLLARLRSDHALTSERIAGLLGEPHAVVAGWESGRAQASDADAARIQHLAGRLNFASLQRWKERVTRARGLEMLIARNLEILAVSDAVLVNSETSGARRVTFPRENFVGRNANLLFPTLDCNLILHHGAGLKDLDAVGIFDGRVRCVRYSAELNYGRFARVGVFEFWPVETVDGGLVVQHLCHVHPTQQPVLPRPGVVVHWSEIIAADTH